MVKMESMEASVTLERVPDLHTAVILNGDGKQRPRGPCSDGFLRIESPLFY
jgi:hypothetical protein